MTTDDDASDESLANFWQGWPEAARQYREEKTRQVEQLRGVIVSLHAAVRERDRVMLNAAHATEAFVIWWSSDDLDCKGQLDALVQAAKRIREVLNT